MTDHVLLEFDINWEPIDGSWWGVAFQVFILLYCFLGLAIVCDDHMVPSLDTLCYRWSVPEDVAGATFMAFGSAASEIIINVVATIQAQMSATPGGQSGNQTNLGVSAILGSGMIAFSLIPATCAFGSEHELLLKRRPLLRDEMFYLAALSVLIYIIYDGVVHYWEAALLVSVYVAYIIVVVFASHVRHSYRKCNGEIVIRKKSFINKHTTDEVAGLLEDEKEHGGGGHHTVSVDDAEDDHDDSSFGKFLHFVSQPLHLLFWLTCPNVEIGTKYEYLFGLTFAMSFAWVSLFSFLLSSIIERWVGISGVNMAVFGLILVSLGAEIPDTIESVSVARKGYGSMAVANCQGTQVVNIAIGLGLSWLIACTSSPITLDHNLLIPAYIQVGVVLTNLSLILGTAIIQGKDKALLCRTRATALYVTYGVAITSFVSIMAWKGALSGGPQ